MDIVQNACVSCMKVEDLFNIHEAHIYDGVGKIEPFSKMLRDTFSIEIDPNSNLSSACCSCVLQMKAATLFKAQILKSIKEIKQLAGLQIDYVEDDEIIRVKHVDDFMTVNISDLLSEKNIKLKQNDHVIDATKKNDSATNKEKKKEVDKTSVSEQKSAKHVKRDNVSDKKTAEKQKNALNQVIIGKRPAEITLTGNKNKISEKTKEKSKIKVLQEKRIVPIVYKDGKIVIDASVKDFDESNKDIDINIKEKSFTSNNNEISDKTHLVVDADVFENFVQRLEVKHFELENQSDVPDFHEADKVKTFDFSHKIKDKTTNNAIKDPDNALTDFNLQDSMQEKSVNIDSTRSVSYKDLSKIGRSNFEEAKPKIDVKEVTKFLSDRTEIEVCKKKEKKSVHFAKSITILEDKVVNFGNVFEMKPIKVNNNNDTISTKPVNYISVKTVKNVPFEDGVMSDANASDKNKQLSDKNSTPDKNIKLNNQLIPAVINTKVQLDDVPKSILATKGTKKAAEAEDTIAKKQKKSVRFLDDFKIETPKFYQSMYEVFKLDPDQTQCSICTVSFATRKKLYEHMHEHYPQFECDKCSKKFVSQKSLKRHMETHLEGPFVCVYCDKLFTKLHSRNSHVWRIHQTSTPYKCSQCNEKFPTFNQRLNHLKEVHDLLDPKYSCSQCEKKYFDSGSLSKHIRAAHETNRHFKCSECPMKFDIFNCLLKHLATKHGIGEKKFACSACGKKYFNVHTLKRHQKLHCEASFQKDNNNKFQCHYCGTTFSYLAVLKCHLKGHETNDKLQHTIGTFISSNNVNEIMLENDEPKYISIVDD